MIPRAPRRVVVLSGFSEARAAQLDVALAVHNCLRVRIESVPEVAAFCCGSVRCDAILAADPALAPALRQWWAAAPRANPCPPVLHDTGEPAEALTDRVSRSWLGETPEV
jgi:hypothetical protein